MKWLPWELLFVLAMVSAAMATPVFEKELPYTHEGREVSSAARLPVDRRLASAMLSDLRLVDVVLPDPAKIEKPKEEGPARPDDRYLLVEARTGNAYFDCVREASHDPALWKTIDRPAFVLSVAAAENYNRRYLRRQLENVAARGLGVVGLPLDPSLGLTQLRLSEAQAVLKRHVPVPLNRAETIQYLEDDCNALQATLWWFEDDMRRMLKAGMTPTVRSLALSYNGGGHTPSEFSYPRLVDAAQKELKLALSGYQDEPEAEVVSFDRLACLFLDPWGARPPLEHYRGRENGESVDVERGAFVASLPPGEPLDLAIDAPPRFGGSLRAKILAHAETRAGVAGGRWMTHPVRRLDPARARDAVEECGGYAEPGMEGRVRVILARRGPPPTSEASEPPPQAEGEEPAD